MNKIVVNKFKTPRTKQKLKNPPALKRKKRFLRRFRKFALVSPNSLLEENDYTWFNIKPIPFQLNSEDSDSDSVPVSPSDININNDLITDDFNYPDFDPNIVDLSKINFDVPSTRSGTLSRIMTKINFK
jgi:hypothetical protein